MQLLTDERTHVVLYAERGRGKTSLANMVTETLRRQGHIVARYSCEASSSFDSVIRGLARDLPVSLLANSMTDRSAGGCEPALPASPLRPADVVELLSYVGCSELVCVVDEFDRISDQDTRTRLADTIKQISDRGVPLAFMIVGVAETLEQILGQHPSIQRNIGAVHLPLLSDVEIAAMLTKGGRDAGITFVPEVLARVTLVARGMPYMAQFLGLRTLQATLARGDTSASEVDLSTAVERLISETRHNVVTQYARLTNDGNDWEMAQALRRIATAEQDRWGRLGLAGSPDRLCLGGRPVSAPIWERLRREHVVTPIEGSPSLFGYGDRSLMYHVLLLAVRSALQDPLFAPATTMETERQEQPPQSLGDPDFRLRFEPNEVDF